MILGLIILLIAVSPVYSLCDDAVILDEMDITNYCSDRLSLGSLTVGDVCLIKPERVRPTQVFIGKVEMECTKVEMESLDSPGLKKMLVDNLVPTVIGPGPDFYIVDHHHFAVALFQAFLDFKSPQIHRVLYACIQDDFSTLNKTTFWKKMIKHNYVFLEDEYGKKITYSDIPPSLKLMADNPYRTFASWMRRSFAYIKCGTKKTHKMPQCQDSSAPFYIECLWANHFREKFPMDDYPSTPDVKPDLPDFIYRASLQLQTEAMLSHFNEGILYSTSSLSKNMPGYNNVQKLLPVVPIELNNRGCPSKKTQEKEFMSN